jgi:hypothetical protein
MIFFFRIVLAAECDDVHITRPRLSLPLLLIFLRAQFHQNQLSFGIPSNALFQSQRRCRSIHLLLLFAHNAGFLQLLLRLVIQLTLNNNLVIITPPKTLLRLQYTTRSRFPLIRFAFLGLYLLCSLLLFSFSFWRGAPWSTPVRTNRIGADREKTGSERESHPCTLIQSQSITINNNHRRLYLLFTQN